VLGEALTTTSSNRNFAWIATSVVALALGLMVCANAFAQSAAASLARVAAPTDDMRLWSFGDCERRFPQTGTPEHKECVRVVGSPEAAEARALRICDVSHSSDKDEAERCKASYKANKVRAAADGVVANAPAAPQAPPSEEVMRRVKAIGSAAVEDERPAKPAASKPADLETSAAPQKSTWKGALMMVVVLAVGVGLGVNLLRRRQAESA
jgi:hypothetical protein